MSRFRSSRSYSSSQRHGDRALTIIRSRASTLLLLGCLAIVGHGHIRHSEMCIVPAAHE